MAEPQQINYIQHDRLIKEFFRRFLERFMWLFYEEKAARLYWPGLRFLDKEQIINQPGQALRITDVAVVVPVIESDEPALQTTVDDNIVRRGPRNKEGETESKKKEELIILHIDAEANKPKPIPHRMFEYYSVYRISEGMPVLPIALLLKGRSYNEDDLPEMDEDSNQMRTYTERLWGEPLLFFRYYEIALQDFMSEEYLDKNDPVAAALAVLMRHPEDMSALIKKRSLEVITQSDEITIEDKHYLVHFVEEYKPDDEVQGGTEEIMKQLSEYKLTWGERIVVERQRELLLRVLYAKFKEIRDEIVERIRAIEDRSIIEELVVQSAMIYRLEDLKLPEPA